MVGKINYAWCKTTAKYLLLALSVQKGMTLCKGIGSCEWPYDNNNYPTGNAPARMFLQTIPATEVTLGLLSWWNFKDLVALTASFA